MVNALRLRCLHEWHLRHAEGKRLIALILNVLLLVLLYSNFAQCDAVAQIGGANAPTLPLQSIESILTAPEMNGYVMIRGTVTWVGNNTAILQDQTSAVRVRLKPMLHLQLGDELEFVGHRVSIEQTTLEGSARRLWSGASPLPLAVSPDQAAEGGVDLLLVETSGKLRKVTEDTNGNLLFTMEGEHQFFTAILDAQQILGSRWPAKAALLDALQPGSLLQLTGVLQLHKNLSQESNGSFLLAVPSSDDINIVGAPPWWTPQHVAAVAIAALLLLVAAFLIHLRNLRARFRAVMEERSRIARDIHDTLAQGFAGIALQLQAAEHVLPVDRDSAQTHLGLALRMVRHSRSESHRAIQMLRTMSKRDSLNEMIKDAAGLLTAGTPIEFSFSSHGEEPLLPYDSLSQIYRIGQEAVANSVRHANATRIQVQLSYEHAQIEMTIIDDGNGFDIAGVAASEEHFGLIGMRERTLQLAGTLDIRSTAEGTCVCIRIPKGK